MKFFMPLCLSLLFSSNLFAGSSTEYNTTTGVKDAAWNTRAADMINKPAPAATSKIKDIIKQPRPKVTPDEKTLQ